MSAIFDAVLGGASAAAQVASGVHGASQIKSPNANKDYGSLTRGKTVEQMVIERDRAVQRAEFLSKQPVQWTYGQAQAGINPYSDQNYVDLEDAYKSITTYNAAIKEIESRSSAVELTTR